MLQIQDHIPFRRISQSNHKNTCVIVVIVDDKNDKSEKNSKDYKNKPNPKSSIFFGTCNVP